MLFTFALAIRVECLILMAHNFKVVFLSRAAKAENGEILS